MTGNQVTPRGQRDAASGGPGPAAKGRRRRGRWGAGWRLNLLRVILVGCVLAVWQLIGGASSHNQFFYSKPSLIGSAFGTLVSGSTFYVDLRYTLIETIAGFLIGGLAGILCGFALAFSRTLYRVVEPIVNALNCLPRIALSSVFILWFGLGIQSKIALVVSLVFFPLFLNTYTGAATADPDQLLLMRTLRASRLDIVRKVMIPSTAPLVITGAKLGVALALAGAVVGEIIAAQHGLGAELSQYANTFATAQMMAVLVVLVVLAIILNAFFSSLEKRTLGWR